MNQNFQIDKSLESRFIHLFFTITSGARFSNVPETVRARKAISKTMKPFMYRAFYVNRFCISAKLTPMLRFESKNLSGFSAAAF